MALTLEHLKSDLPALRRLTVEEFERGWKAGIYGPDERLEVIDGYVFQKVTQDSSHSSCILAVHEALLRIFGEEFHIRTQLPLLVGSFNRAEPDVSVVRGHWREYVKRHPSTAVLVIEVGVSSVVADRRTKAALYARARVPEYWIVNLPKKQLEVFRGLTEAESSAYRETVVLGFGGKISPLSAPEFEIEVKSLFP